MSRVVLIACCSKKLNKRAEAKDLYISSLFKYSYKYAKKLEADYIFVLSAKYGLLKLDDVIEPYNETLNNKSERAIKLWADNVIDDLNNYIDLTKDEFIFLAGHNFR
jgi:cytoplasmic iron level regulating protein YaaA (DUF328/UPF0246 family)